jgi:hypothetical protein
MSLSSQLTWLSASYSLLHNKNVIFIYIFSELQVLGKRKCLPFYIILTFYSGPGYLIGCCDQDMGLDNWGVVVRFPTGAIYEYLFSEKRPDRLWCLPCLLVLPEVKHGVNDTSHLLLNLIVMWPLRLSRLAPVLTVADISGEYVLSTFLGG